MEDDDWIYGGRYTYDDRKDRNEKKYKKINKKINKLDEKLKQIREENQKEIDKYMLKYNNKKKIEIINSLNEEKKENNNLENDNNNLDDSDNEEEYTKDYLNNFDTVVNIFKDLNIVSKDINNINDMKKNSYYKDLLRDFNKFYSKCEELKEETVSNMEKYMKDNINNTCSICYQKFDKVDDMIVTKCKHIFHKDCLNIWFEKKSKCPLCRRFIYNNQK